MPFRNPVDLDEVNSEYKRDRDVEHEIMYVTVRRSRLQTRAKPRILYAEKTTRLCTSAAFFHISIRGPSKRVVRWRDRPVELVANDGYLLHDILPHFRDVGEEE